MERSRNELSSKSKYWISKHRYLELKHFCLQYPEWKRQLNSINNLPSSNGFVRVSTRSSDDFFIDHVVLCRINLEKSMSLVEQAAQNTDGYLAPFIFAAVTEEKSYTWLREHGMACGKDMFYDRYHKFFWLLDQTR